MRKLTAIQKSARGEECALRIPGVCNSNPETTVLCHAPYPGRSGMRSHDWWAAYGCSSCHDYVDGRTRETGFALQYDPIVKVLETAWLPAIHETQAKLLQKGFIWLGENQQSAGSKIIKRSAK